MEEGERKTSTKISASQSQAPPIYKHPTANGKSSGSVEKVPQLAGHAGGNSSTAEGLAGIAAKILSSKAKVQGASKGGTTTRKKDKHNGFDDDLPLGSEAHSLSLDHGTDIDGKYPVNEEKRSKWRKTSSLGMMGWQSFNSDVSNQTSASSASLEQLLNDRQVDPEEMLMSLGFGGGPQSLMPTLARVPERFLHHPSRAYGITPPNLSEELEDEDDTDAVLPLPDKGTAPSAIMAAAAPPTRKRPGIWTLARTLSMLRLRTSSARGHMSPSSNSSGTQPQSNHPVSILHPANQRYLASRGFYEKQGWPKGSFAEPEEDPLRAVKEDGESKDAASKRKIFKKTRPQRNWSICDSGENEATSGSREWISKSVDDSRSREDLAGQDDSLGRGTYFSTTTESSTDSLDTPNLETERAFENIRREYERSRLEGSSSDDLFLPYRKKRLPSDILDENLDSDHGLDLLSTGAGSSNYFVSPASSRQTTVEKAPTICEQSPSINLGEGGGVDNESNGDTGRPDVNNQLTYSSSNKMGNVCHSDEDGRKDVRIIISGSDSKSGKYWSHDGSRDNQNDASSKLTVDSVQATSSDSGSSSATAVGSSITLTTDKLELRRFSESENSLTDWDSISRTNSPHCFGRGTDVARRMVSSSCQTTDSDFRLAAAADTGNQHVNVTTLTTSNKSILFVRIDKSGLHSPTQDRKREYAYVEQSPRVQLSTFPPTINHLELMKRLQHSQNELSRMGSVQSDSSGFGDTDPAVESGLPEPDSLKLASLGSSIESCKTLASSAATTILARPRTEEMATQTPLHSDKIKTSREVWLGVGEESGHIKQSPRPSEQDHYVTMCYIPTLPNRDEPSSTLRHRATRPPGDADHFVSYHGAPAAGSIWRSRSGSGSRLQSPSRLWSSTDFNGDHIRYPGVRDRSLSNRYGSQGFPTGRSLVYPYTHSPGDLHKNIDHHRPQGYYNSADLQQISDRGRANSQKTFTSQINLYTNSGSFSRQSVSSGSHPGDSHVGFRRHSDEGILESRNNAPLSIELELARSSGIKSLSPPYTTNSSQTTPPLRGNNSETTSMNHAPAFYDNPAVAAHSSDFRTQADFHHSLIAGNISGLSSRLSSEPLDSSKASRSPARQRSCDILDDDFDDKEALVAPPHHSKMSDDLDSPIGEISSSDFSVQSAPEGHGHIKSGVLESRKLARLINQPIQFKGSRRCGYLYHPTHLFKEWCLLSKRKRLQEENRLLQNAVQKYKTELTVMEASLMVDYQTVYSDMTDPEKEELEELEWLWGEVKGQVIEMEHILMARAKAVHAGNEFYSLMSSLGIINRMVELIKEQICQQQMASSRTEETRDRSLDDEIFAGEMSYHNSGLASQSWLAGMGHMSTPRTVRRFQSSSTSNLPHDLNISLEQIKSSVLSQVKDEIKESTKKFEQDLQEKDREIKQLQDQLRSRSQSLTETQPRRWTPKTSISRSRVSSRSRTPSVKDKSSQETDV